MSLLVDTWTVPATGRLKIGIPGNYIMVLESTIDLNIFIKRSGTESGRAFGVPEAWSYGPVEQSRRFDALEIESVPGTQAQVQLAIADDATELRRISGTIDVSKPGNLTGSGDTTIATATTQTIAARSDRREITVQADDGNSGPLFLRDAGGAVAIKLVAGASATVPGTAAVQVRNDSGAQQTYRYLEVRD